MQKLRFSNPAGLETNAMPACPPLTSKSAVLVQPELENECSCLLHSGDRTARFIEAWGNALNDRGQTRGLGRKRSSAPGDHSSHTRPAIPGELDASRARVCFTGWVDYAPDGAGWQRGIPSATGTGAGSMPARRWRRFSRASVSLRSRPAKMSASRPASLSAGVT